MDWRRRGDPQRSASGGQDLIFPVRMRAWLLHLSAQRRGADLRCLDKRCVSCDRAECRIPLVDKGVGRLHVTDGQAGAQDSRGLPRPLVLHRADME